jgi:hypothetical protein
LARKIILTAVYLTIAWTLMVSYQIFTKTALASVAVGLSGSVPIVALWLNTSSDLVVFICGFAWMFVLSAMVSTLMFGKERRLSIQFLVSLVLTIAGSTLLGALGGVGLDLSDPYMLSSPFTWIFGNGLFAGFYLALPFIFMLVLDIRALRKRK